MQREKSTLAKYNELVRREFKIQTHAKNPEQAEKGRIERELFYDWLELYAFVVDGGYMIHIPVNRTLSRNIEFFEFKTMPRESFAYKLREVKECRL